MKKLYYKRKIILILVTLCFISNIVGANTISNNLENSSIKYKETLFESVIQCDEFLKTPLCSSDNQPPEKPKIEGPSRGKAGVELTYTFVSTDPEGGKILYCFDWGDESGGVCIGPFPSGEKVNVSHTWEDNGTYIISVNASDPLGAKSETATHKIKIPRYRTSICNFNLFGWFLKRLTLMEKFLSNNYIICSLFR